MTSFDDVKARLNKVLVEAETIDKASGRLRYAAEKAFEDLAKLEAETGTGGTPTPTPTPEPTPTPTPEPTPTPTPTPAPTPTPFDLNAWVEQLGVSVDGVLVGGMPLYEDPLVVGDRTTHRVTIPLETLNLYLVLLYTEGHVSYVVECRNPDLFGATLTPFGYHIVISDPMHDVLIDRTISEYKHSQWQRWRAQNHEWPIKGQSAMESAIHNGWIMYHRYNPFVLEKSLTVETEYVPLGNYGFLRAFATTGGRQEIGLNHALFARAVRKCFEGVEYTSYLNAAMLVAETHSHMPTHVRDSQGRMVHPRIPGYEKIGLQDGYGDGNPDDIFYNQDITNGGWKMDKAHRGNALWGKIVMQGGPDECDPYLIEEHQFLAAATLNQSWTAYRGDNADKFTFWTRVMAWGMRDFAQTVAVTPETVPDWLLPKDFFAPNLADIAAEFTDRFAVEPGLTFGTTHPASYFKDVDDHASNVEDYNAFSLIHVYRLTGDEKWKRLAHHFIERKLATNYVIAPLYHRDYLEPLKAPGEFYSSWAEMHQAKGHNTDQNAQWYRFDQPFEGQSSRADVAMQNYDALQMARDSGANSFIIDKALEIMTKQYYFNSEGEHTRASQDQFAMMYTPVRRTV